MVHGTALYRERVVVMQRRSVGVGGRSASGRRRRFAPLLLGVLAIALTLLSAGPALAQAADDQYGSGGSNSVGEHAANAAVTAAQAWEQDSEGSAEDTSTVAGGTATASSAEESGSASEVDSEGEESGSDEDVPKGITMLPETGGPSTPSLGILLVVAGVLVRGIIQRVFHR